MSQDWNSTSQCGIELGIRRTNVENCIGAVVFFRGVCSHNVKISLCNTGQGQLTVADSMKRDHFILLWNAIICI